MATVDILRGLRGRISRLQRDLQKQISDAKSLLVRAVPVNDQTAVDDFMREIETHLCSFEEYSKRFDVLLDQMSCSALAPDEDETARNEEIGALQDISIEAAIWLKRLRAYLDHIKLPTVLPAHSDSQTTPTFSPQFERQIERLITAVQSPTLNSTQSDRVFFGPDSNQPHNEIVPGSVKLPKIELKQFSGDITHWKEFWDMFEVTIDQNPRLQQVEKLNYLIMQLAGDAREAVAGLKITSNSYAIAIDILTERFGNTQLAVSTIHSRLMNLAPVSNNTAKLRSFYDQVECNLRSLVTLNQEIDSQHFISLLMTKLPTEVLMALERSKDPAQNWSVSLLRQKLHIEISARESVERHQFDKPKQPEKPGERQESGKQHQFYNKQSHFSKYRSRPSENRPSTTEALFSSGTSLNQSNKPRTKYCIFCAGSHWSDECSKYPSVDTRKPRIRDRCYICFSQRHTQKDCQVTRPCAHCNIVGKHHRSLCVIKFGKKRTENAHIASDATVETKIVQPATTDNPKASEGVLLATGQSVLLQTASTRVRNHYSRNAADSEKIRLLLDCGSNRSYITQELAKKLNLRTTPGEPITVNRFATSKSMHVNTQNAEIELYLMNGEIVPLTVTVIPQITGSVFRCQIDTKISKQCKGLPLADSFPTKTEQSRIDLLIGTDYYLDIVTGERIPLQNGLYMLGSKLGWLLTGRIPNPTKNPSRCPDVSLLSLSYPSMTLPESSFLSKIDNFPDFAPSMEDLWKLESIGIKDPPEETENDAALKQFNDSVQFENKRYQVTWPWRDNSHELPDNFDLSLGRLRSTVKKLQDTPELLKKYNDIIQDQLEKGVIEKEFVEDDKSIKHYIPHFAVITPQKSTTKVRIVYDASAKTKKCNLSLNDCLYKGPVFLENLCGLLLRFRLPKIALLSDIEKAFLQIGLQPSQRDVTRFLWLKEPDKQNVNQNLQIYRFCRVPFGMVSSPFLLGATIAHHLQQNGSQVAQNIRTNIYMDNVVIGADSTSEAIITYTEAKQIFKAASMNLREWTSNDAKFLDKIPTVDRTTPGCTKVLGMLWNTRSDQLSVVVPNETNDIRTKRGITKQISQIFDPLGLFSPITITSKLFLQTLWEQAFEWDEILPKHLLDAWNELKEELLQIATITIPRHIGLSKTDANFQLICFTDASTKSFAAAVYLRILDGIHVQTTLIFSKSRVAPKKPLTIPRLELLGVVIGIRCIKFVQSELRIPITRKILWTDSQCVLHWLHSNKTQGVFVNNRVIEIKRHTDVELRYVNTKDNPADVATRGTTISELTNLWWNGPQWLNMSEEDWPVWKPTETTETEPKPPPTPSPLYEATIIAQECSLNQFCPFNITIEQFSKFLTLIRCTAWCKRFVKKCRRQTTAVNPTLSAEEIEEATADWIRYVQNEYLKEVKASLTQRKKHQYINQFDLMLDKEGFIRCGGRIENAALGYSAKHPKLLPAKAYLTTIIIRHFHSMLYHAGTSQTLAHIRNEYWIPQGRRAVASVIRKCTTCRKHEGGPFKLPRMPNLPKSRVNVTPAFTNIGLDYFGPLYIKTMEGNQKIWVCLFTCLTVRAIHLELVTSLSSEHFLLCLRRFMARRGKPNEIISDNAKQFRAVAKVTDQAWTSTIRDPDTLNYCANNNIKWKFIVELSPWSGGFYERLIGIIKRAMRKSLGKLCLTLDQLHTVICELEVIVNSRPLTYAEDNTPSGLLLTPSHFLTVNPKTHTPIQSVSEDSVFSDMTNPSSTEHLLEFWKKGLSHLDGFWKVWQKEYLLSLREKLANTHRNPRIHTNDAPKVGQVVLIKEPMMPRGKWKIGRISRIITGNDSSIRAAEIRLPNKRILRRPINLLFPIEGEETEINNAIIPSGDNNESSLLPYSRPQRQAALRARQRIAEYNAK